MKLVDGRKTVTTAGTAVRLGTESIRSLAITALSTNTGTICVGGSTVKAKAEERRGIPLAAGQSVSIDTDDVADAWLDATVNGEGVSWMAVSTE
jgi:deoxyhypusine synthase